MILDEVLGNLDYAARQSGLLEAGPAVTARIEVEFRQVSCLGRLFQLDASPMSLISRRLSGCS